VGHFVLFQELKQCLIDSSTDSFNSRVVIVASIGHRYVARAFLFPFWLVVHLPEATCGIPYHNFHSIANLSYSMSGVPLEDPNYAHRPWDAISAYGQSKTANIYMANYIDRTYGPQGLHAWSLQPGGIISNLVTKSEENKKAIFGKPEILPWLKTPEQGAATSVWAATARDLEGKGGRYLESMQEIREWKGPEERRVDVSNVPLCSLY